jgi:hypothetical protein
MGRGTFSGHTEVILDPCIITAEKTGHYHRLKIKPGISLSHPPFGWAFPLL